MANSIVLFGATGFVGRNVSEDTVEYSFEILRKE
jgi:short subunit dehydrogenase-like uncharacterized protein